MSESENTNIADMKFICACGKGELINVKKKTVSKKTTWTSFQRWWEGEDRRSTLDFVKTTIEDSLDLTEKRLQRRNQFEYQDEIHYIPARIVDLISSLTALENLMFTYGNDDDRIYRCNLAVLKESIEARLKTMSQNHPDVFPKDYLLQNTTASTKTSYSAPIQIHQQQQQQQPLNAAETPTFTSSFKTPPTPGIQSPLMLSSSSSSSSSSSHHPLHNTNRPVTATVNVDTNLSLNESVLQRERKVSDNYETKVNAKHTHPLMSSGTNDDTSQQIYDYHHYDNGTRNVDTLNYSVGLLTESEASSIWS